MKCGKTQTQHIGPCKRSFAAAIESLELRALLSSYSISSLATFGVSPGFGNVQHNVVLDSSGDVFGVATLGGTNSSGGIFELPKGSQTPVLRASFGVDVTPSDITIDSAGNIYGLSDAFGSAVTTSDLTAYELPAGGSSLMTLADLDDNSLPTFAGAPLVDSSGDLFGTTIVGGANRSGEIFEVKKGAGSATVLASFPNTSSGEIPGAENLNEGLLMDASGNLYGSTSGAGTFGTGNGTVFELAAGSSTLTTLCTFDGTTTGSNPASIVMDSHGNIYGDLMNNNTYNDTSVGAVFELAAGTTTPTILAPFTAVTGINSYYPLTIDNAGDLFGVSHFGGNDLSNGFDGIGVVFELPSGANALAPVYSFAAGANGQGVGPDGALPFGTVTLDSSGNLYGADTGDGLTVSSILYKLSTGGSSGGGGSGALSGSLSGTLPSVAQIAGQRDSISQKLALGNSSSGALSGHVSASFFLSSDGAVDSSSIALPGSISRKISLKAGKGISFPFHFSAIPKGTPSGTYQIIAQVTDTTGTVSDVASTGSLIVEPAEIDLAGTFVRIAPALVKTGRNVMVTFQLTNNGDVTATGSLPIQVDLSTTSTDNQGLVLPPIKHPIAVHAGKTMQVTAAAKTLGIPDGTYYVFVKLDPNNTLGDINTANNNFNSIAPVLTVSG